MSRYDILPHIAKFDHSVPRGLLQNAQDLDISITWWCLSDIRTTQLFPSPGPFSNNRVHEEPNMKSLCENHLTSHYINYQCLCK